MEYQQKLTLENIYFLQQGINLLKNIGDDIYRNNNHPYFSSGAGKHMRHVLDHYSSFLCGDNGKIDYDIRKRDLRLESERLYAIQKAEEVIENLRNQFLLKLNNNDCIDVNCNEGCVDEAVSPWCQSTISRELQYLVSHTVHHYALIAMILRIQGHEPPPTFGIAPSTLKYQAELAERS